MAHLGRSTTPAPRPRCLLPIIAVLLAYVATAEVRAQSTASPEYQLKAVFLYHFTRFVEWPEEAFSGSDVPFVIGVLGEDPFGTYLEEILRGETVAGRPIETRRYGRTDDYLASQILFVNVTEDAWRARLLEELEDAPVLTVGDSSEFAEGGGIVQFMTHRGKIRLRVNVERARRSRLRLSARLLGLADIVSSEGS